MARPATKALVGERYGRLVIVAEADRVDGRRRVVVRCDCGNQGKIIDPRNIAKGNTVSCGCVRGEFAKRRGEQIREEAKRRAADILLLGQKKCNRCNNLLSVEKFYKKSDVKDGIDNCCIECSRNEYQKNKSKYAASARRRSQEWYYANRERVLENNKDRYRANPEPNKKRAREHYEKHKDRYRQLSHAWYVSNKDIACAWQREYKKRNRYRFNEANRIRKANARKATPHWADRNAIREFYKNTPDGFHVDHIVPLKSDIVCGLHVLANLQYLPAKENIIKSNRYWLDMPEQEYK